MNEDTIERLQADHDARVAAIREREQKATPGPWSNEWDWRLEDGDRYEGWGTGPTCCTGSFPELSRLVQADSAFIAHARQDIPFLLADNALIGMALVNERAAREAARARLAKAVAALEKVEWIYDESLDRTVCAWCGGYKRHDHAPDCQRQQALKEARHA
jgi:hypothetical protein